MLLDPMQVALPQMQLAPPRMQTTLPLTHPMQEAPKLSEMDAKLFHGAQRLVGLANIRNRLTCRCKYGVAVKERACCHVSAGLFVICMR